METIKQICIFIENEPGSLVTVLKILSENGIDIRALYIAETNDYGIIRLIVNDYKKAYELLKNKKYVVSINDVFAIEVCDKAGGLVGMLNEIAKENVDIEYMYSIIGKNKNVAYMIIAAKNIEMMNESLKKHNIITLSFDKVIGEL